MSRVAIKIRPAVDRPFDERLRAHGLGPLRRSRLRELQVNVGRRCNQACNHCHVDAGPHRSEEMAGEMIDLVLDVLRARRVPTLDITGGAPELNPHFRRLASAARALGVQARDVGYAGLKDKHARTRQWLSAPGTRLLYEGATISDDHPAELVTIMNSADESVTLAIDSDTHLPLRKRYTIHDPKLNFHRDEAEVYGNWHLVQGIQTPYTVTRYTNNEMTGQRFIHAVTYNQAVGDEKFNATVNWNPLR